MQPYRSVTLTLLLALVIQQGCSTLPTPPTHATNWVASLGTVGLDVKQVNPKLESDFALHGKGEGAAKGALKGIFDCMGSAGGGAILRG